MASKETKYKDAYELIDKQKKDSTKKEFPKLSRRRPAKTLRTIAAGVAFLLTLTALVLVVAFRVDTINRLDQNEETQTQISEQSSAQKSQQDDLNEEFAELLNQFNEAIHNRLNSSREVVRALENASNVTVNALRFQLKQEVQELLLQLNMSDTNIRAELTSKEQTLQSKINNLTANFQEQISDERQSREESFSIFQHQSDQTINNLSSQLSQQIDNIGSRVTNISEAILAHINSTQTEILQTISKLQCPGLSQRTPARSCQQVKDCDPSLEDGLYWLQGMDNSSSLIYCDFDWTCEYHNKSGAWQRVKYWDVRNSVDLCEGGLQIQTSDPPGLRCSTKDSQKCFLVTIDTNQVQYNKVCGRIVGFGTGSLDGFEKVDRTRYLDGVALLNSQDQHIWSFAAVSGDRCPSCNDQTVSLHNPVIPVGTDYFCSQYNNDNEILWTGNDCSAANNCCSVNRPPWFFKQFLEPMTDNIEMRVCTSELVANERLSIQQVEIYVQ